MPSKPETDYMDSEKPMHIYEYAVVRYVPHVERQEFINIGLILMCKRQGLVLTRFKIDPCRISALCPGTDVEILQQQITGFRRVASGDTDMGGAIAELPAHERFRWLTAVRSASLQTSRPHSGLSADLNDTFDRLFRDLVD